MSALNNISEEELNKNNVWIYDLKEFNKLCSCKDKNNLKIYEHLIDNLKPFK